MGKPQKKVLEKEEKWTALGLVVHHFHQYG